jgi:hypothetical protein
MGIVLNMRLEPSMDLVYLAGIIVFFALLAAMAIGCAKLGKDTP